MFLKKLDILMEQRKINKNILAKESGIPYTTIDGFYKKGYENTKLSTLQKICSYFDVTLDYLVRDDVFDMSYGKEENLITEDEKKILISYRTHPEQHAAIHKLLDIEVAAEITAENSINAKLENYRLELEAEQQAIGSSALHHTNESAG